MGIPSPRRPPLPRSRCATPAATRRTRRVDQETAARQGGLKTQRSPPQPTARFAFNGGFDKPSTVMAGEGRSSMDGHYNRAIDAIVNAATEPWNPLVRTWCCDSDRRSCLTVMRARGLDPRVVPRIHELGSDAKGVDGRPSPAMTLEGIAEHLLEAEHWSVWVGLAEGAFRRMLPSGEKCIRRITLRFNPTHLLNR